MRGPADPARQARPTILSATGSAIFSPCHTWRYVLRRDFGTGQSSVNFIMLNPSSATATRDDATIRRCTGFARQWGFATLVVTNLFALRSPEPQALRRAADPIGPENDAHLLEQARRAGAVVVAWGNHGALGGRAARVLDLLGALPALRLEHFGATRAGQPRHPLFVPARTHRLPLPPLPSILSG